MARPRRLDHDKVVELYVQELLTPREIGARLHAHPDTIAQIVRKAGVSRPAGRPKRILVCKDCGSHNIEHRLVAR